MKGQTVKMSWQHTKHKQTGLQKPINLNLDN